MITLPDTPYVNHASPRVLDFGGFLEPSSGGEVQRINRMGNRYAVAFSLPPLVNATDGRIWVNRLVRGLSEGVRIRYPLLGFAPGVTGTFTVDGDDQTGTSLNITGGQPNYIFREGQPFSMIVNGRSYFDFIAATTVADGSGDATITLSQMLRVSPATGDALNFARPIVEGFLMGNPVSWELPAIRFIGASFEVHEAR